MEKTPSSRKSLLVIIQFFCEGSRGKGSGGGGGRLFKFEWEDRVWGGRLFEAESLLTFSAFRMGGANSRLGAYSNKYVIYIIITFL